MTRDGIEVFEKDKDLRFRDNQLNDSPFKSLETILISTVRKENGSCVDQLRWVTSSAWEKEDSFSPN